MEHVLEFSIHGRIKKQWRCLVAPLTPEQVTAARALLNWSRVSLGAKCDLSEADIREFERGGRLPSPEKLLACARHSGPPVSCFSARTARANLSSGCNTGSCSGHQS
ncbi:helix-turn-helix domain-containing protein [Mesorhizobium sp. CA4]|uniref:helix-turn-helix domain-containing protein n=1 Tax=Mesorhizobium sp. CA4 TaxID=588499 RepID=UPI00398D0A21